MNEPTSFDTRLTPARADLAAKHLEGRVQAARFVEGVLREVIEPHAPLRRAPSQEAALDTEALFGEKVIVYESDHEGWSWCQLAGDSYVGWLPTNALGAVGPPPTHKVVALRTLVFARPSIKSPPLASLPLGSLVSIAGEDDPMSITAKGSYIPARHLAPLSTYESDFVSVAERFLGTPYLWGGKTNYGLDCSGLVQVSLYACGIECPRDSDMQERTLGEPLAAKSAVSSLQRGDLIFWKGHVAIARDASTIIHANAHHMVVAIEPANEAIARIGASGSEITTIRRL